MAIPNKLKSTKRTFSTENTIVVDSDVARGLLEYLNVTAVVVGWKLFRAEMQLHWNKLYLLTFFQEL